MNPTKTGVNSGVPEGWAIFCSTCGTCRVTFVANPVISHSLGNATIERVAGITQRKELFICKRRIFKYSKS